jgi:hypothetical protein
MAKDGVREGYPLLLYSTLLLTSVLFSVFGVLGYGSFGDELCRYDTWPPCSSNTATKSQCYHARLDIAST